MYYVYLLQSIPHPEQRYVGFTRDVSKRLAGHNAGRSPHTAKYRPWNLVVAIAFQDKQRALDFESYLKTGSGRAFARRHFW